MERDRTLKELLYTHDNDYGFEPIEVRSFDPENLPNLSIVIPYFETGELIVDTTRKLYNSIRNAKSASVNWSFEVIIMDDGSEINPADAFLKREEWENLQINQSNVNLGRSINRDLGLRMANYPLTLFMDSDIIVDDQLILNHLKTHLLCREINKKSCISLSFFRFTDDRDPLLKREVIKPEDIRINDWRIKCTYDETWIGCDDDKRFIGQKISILEETKNFKAWDGKFKAWMLSNMVLGGFFMVDRVSSLKVGGFDSSFKGYGFTETPLSTKLIAGLRQFVVPVVIGGALHVDQKYISLSKKEKDKIFKEKHDYYFNNYLEMSLEEVIMGKK